MKKYFRKSVLLAILLYTTVGHAQVEKQTYTLKQTVKYALQNSFNVQKAVLDIEQADHKIGEVKSQGLPQINGVGNFNNFPNLPTQLLPGEIIGEPAGTFIPVQFGTEYTASGGFEATQLIYNQSYFTGLKAVKSSEELYKLLKLGTEEDVIYEVANAFYSVLELQAQRDVLEANIDQIVKMEALMKTRFENDLVTKTDYNRLRVNRTNMETTLQSLTTAEATQTNYLKLLMGMPIDADIELVPAENIAEVNLNSLHYEKLEPTQLKIIDQQIELNRINQKNFAAGYYPSLVAFGTQNWQAQRNEFNFFDGNQPWFQQTVIGLKLEVPIFDGLRKHHQIAQAKIDVQKAEVDRLNVLRGNQMEYKNAIEQLVNTLKSVEAQKENRELAQEVYNQTQELYNNSVGTLTDFLNAENALREAQINYYREILKFKKAELDLLKAQGQLLEIAKS